MVATDSRWSVPPHIQPPMAHVPSATRETFTWVPGISTNSISTAGVRAACVDADMELASRRLLVISGCGLGRDAGPLSACQTVSVCQTVRNHAEENGGDEHCRDECKHTNDI